MQVGDLTIRGIAEHALKEPQTVTPAGESVAPRIEGVEFRPARAHTDERGSLIEVFSEGWGFTDTPVVHVYQVSVRPGRVRGPWVVHRYQDDRLFFSTGCAKVALFDAREGSATDGLVDVRYLGVDAPGLLVIPAGVWHAVRNIGDTDLTFINLPTQPYDYADPDKHRLPLDNDLIPYRP
jgi:dTDP-4-dehydrorhamnose 3,5-epimerase